MVGFNFAPVGWALCQGQLLPIAQNPALFQLIGTTYGGDGQTTFALPDLRGRVPMHPGNGHVLAEKDGAETVTLTTQQIPSHAHPAQASSSPATSTNLADNVWADWGSTQYSDQAVNAQMSVAAMAAAGGSQPHDNVMPYLAVNFIISLEGVFPTQ
jgi:microcystin-dependent protein